ncbi:uncharacterized protein LOC133332512 [Musca vetustissima]|uniref:uncharacterized protein LOC133332512 n=1 Tax=Musca vetustissima TaxID=27455 RepID=UPI002AB6BFFB|nr:uncharacterized protein LOC133332512 [Musca vetustissima]
MARESFKYMKWSWFLVVLLLALTFVPPSQEFSFGWGDDDGKSKEAAGTSASREGRKQPKRHLVEKKYKFHKIERVIPEGYDEDEAGDEDADGGGDDNASNNLHDRTEENNAGEELDEDEEATQEKDEEEEDEEGVSRKERAASINSANNDDEEEEYRFKKARKAEKPARSTKQKASSTESQEKSGSWFSSLFGGGSSNKDDSSKQQQQESAEEPAATKSNGIIDWILWLGERTGRLRPDSTEDTSAQAASSESSGESWMNYLNRWPFNSLFPIGKPPKPIKMPKVAKKPSRDASRDEDAASHEPPMSQESFDNLLYSLPNFIVKPQDIENGECREQLQIFQRQLRGHKLWTLQMIDATGKVGPGLLRGNINQFGDFNMCTDIKTIVKVTSNHPVRIRGKYCLAHIEMQTSVSELKIPVHMLHGRGLFNSHLGNPYHFIPRYGVANWGICVPNACEGDVVRQMLQESLKDYNNTGVELHVEVDDNDCYVKHNRKFLKLLQKDKKFCATVLYIIGLFLITLSTMAWENWSRIQPMLQRVVTVLKIIAGTVKNMAMKTSEFSKGLMEKLKKKPESGEEGDNKEEEEAKVDEEKKNEEESEKATKEEEAEEQETENENKEEETEPEKSEEPAEAEEGDPTSDDLSLNTLALEIFKSFSPKRSLGILLADDDTHDVPFPLFHVLKVVATLMLYLCLKFLMIGHLPITNRDQLVRTFDNPLSVLIRSPMIYADILLLISGFLTAYQLSEEMEQKSYIQLLKRMALKVSRYLPTVYLLICFQTWILPHLNSGPLWPNLIGQNSRLCDDQWWRNILSLQNAIDFEETCSPSTIQLALEVQLYLMGPLVVWLYYTDSDASFFVYGGLHAMSVAARYARTNKEHLSMTLFHGINVSKFYRTANILYSSPISRATTYLLGIGAGIFQRSNSGVLDLTPEMVKFGWSLASLGILWCFWSPASSMRTDFIYTSSDAASYASWCPLVFGLSLCWIIFMLPRDSENPILKFLTTSKVFLVLSRLIFPIQMVMYIVVLYGTAKVKETDKFHLTDLFNFQEIALILLGAVVVSFLVDIPSQNIRRLIINRIFIERPHLDGDDHATSEGEPMSEASEENSEQVATTSDTPEPPDTVWGSDPEEEEQKYIQRRRSSLLESDVKKGAETKKEETEEEEEEEVEEEEEEEEEISEKEEVKKHP